MPVFRSPMTGSLSLIVIIRVGMPGDSSIKHPFTVVRIIEPIIMVIKGLDTPPGIIIEDHIIRKKNTGIIIITATTKNIRPAIRSFSAFRCAKFLSYLCWQIQAV